MAVTQARTMPGVLELLPLDQVAFQSMLDAIRRNFERFGFLPIETPVMEFSSILLTKEGGETEPPGHFGESTGPRAVAGHCVGLRVPSYASSTPAWGGSTRARPP